MTAKVMRIESGMRNVPEFCDCFDAQPTRREFIGRASCALLAAIAASGVALDAAHAHPIAVRDVSGQGTEHSYALPSADGINIDQDNEVILVRSANHIYAFALACPHENTALRWRPQDQRFQCPRQISSPLTQSQQKQEACKADIAMSAPTQLRVPLRSIILIQ